MDGKDWEGLRLKMKAHPGASCMGTELPEAGQGDRVLGWSWADPHPHPVAPPTPIVAAFPASLPTACDAE